MPVYRHTQIGYLILAAVGAALVAVSSEGARSSGVPVFVMGVLGLALVFFSTLTVVVSDAALDVFFGPGLIRRRINLRDVRDARVVRNPWYCGWGIRWIGRGWMWNVSGLRAVELEFGDGRRFRIGSDEPEALLAALRRRQ